MYFDEFTEAPCTPEGVDPSGPCWDKYVYFDVASGTEVQFPFYAALWSNDETAKIYYTIDGTDPSQTSSTTILYTAPILIENSGVLVKARVKTHEDCWGPICSASWIDSIHGDIQFKFVCNDSEDHVGRWSEFGPDGNARPDYHWRLLISTDYMLIKRLEIYESDAGGIWDGVWPMCQAWSTDNPVYPFSERPTTPFWIFPIVMIRDGNQLYTDYTDTVGPVIGDVSIDLWGQPETVPSTGHFKLKIFFDDGSVFQAIIPMVCESSSSSSSSESSSSESSSSSVSSSSSSSESSSSSVSSSSVSSSSVSSSSSSSRRSSSSRSISSSSSSSSSSRSSVSPSLSSSSVSSSSSDSSASSLSSYSSSSSSVSSSSSSSSQSCATGCPTCSQLESDCPSCVVNGGAQLVFESDNGDCLDEGSNPGVDFAGGPLVLIKTEGETGCGWRYAWSGSGQYATVSITQGGLGWNGYIEITSAEIFCYTNSSPSGTFGAWHLYLMSGSMIWWHGVKDDRSCSPLGNYSSVGVYPIGTSDCGGCTDVWYDEQCGPLSDAHGMACAACSPTELSVDSV